LLFAANSAWTFGIASGSLLVDVKNNLDFGIAGTSYDPNTFTTTGNGHTTLRGGNRVQFANGKHTYNGSIAGDYWVDAVGSSQNPYHGHYYCGDGDIITLAAAPVAVKNTGVTTGTGDLKWEAWRDINTNSDVLFQSDSVTDIDWISHTRDILTHDTVRFENQKQTSTGYTRWTAYRDIVTSSNITPLSAENGVTFTHEGKGLTRWEATNGNIQTRNYITFLHADVSTGNTEWWAGKNIWTEKPVTFINEGSGYTTWRANGGNIITGYGTGNDGYVGRVEFLNLNDTASNPYTTWSARDSIVTHAHVYFRNETHGKTLWQADTYDIITNDSVTFINTSTANTEWRAYRDITTNDTVEFTNTGTGNTKWWAETGNITTNRGKPENEGFVTFNNTNYASHDSTNTDWDAYLNIRTNNVVTFNNDVDSGGYIKWWAHTVNIEMNDSTIFNQAGEAGTGASLRNVALSTVPPRGSLWLLAQKNIFSENDRLLQDNSPGGENEEPLLINYGADNNAPIMLWAVEGSVILDGVLHVDRQNTGISESTIEAGRDIHFLDTVTWYDHSNEADILLHAGLDIRVNDSTCNDEHTAPVFFTVTDSVTTHWVADRNITTRDTLDFNYGDTGYQVQDLRFAARGGNIKTWRWFNIDFDGNAEILLSAVDDLHEFQYPYLPPGSRVNNSGPESDRHLLNGNIWLNDSVKITRTNDVEGKTNILAKYNIRTAMVDIHNRGDGDNATRVESYLGDIYLGYSTHKDDCQEPGQDAPLSYDGNRFLYTSASDNDSLNILSGFDDKNNNTRYGGGNIYFTHLDATTQINGVHPTQILIPFSNEYFCGSTWSPALLKNLGLPASAASRTMYEHAGIIGGVGPCGVDKDSAAYAPSEGWGATQLGATDTSLIYRGNRGDLLVDAGTRGNIIMNRGGYLNYRDAVNTGNALFRTRNGNIDMRNPFNADSLQGGLLFLASSDLPGKLNVQNCSCDEERNNVYLQDFRYLSHGANGGSVYVGADNNIKLQYGGLKTVGSTRDPFFSPNSDGGYPCGSLKFHCNSDTSVNQARSLILNFSLDTFNLPITRGGFAAVASDLIDVYKDMVYTGGQGSGMSAVPGQSTLHGEQVAGYGLYIKTQGNKKNWNKTDFEIDHQEDPEKGAACDDNECSNSYLHNTARVTFHSDARIYAEAQKALIESPVLDTYGFLDLNTSLNPGARTGITIRTDSLICHDSLIVDGPKTDLSSWSGLRRDMPVVKLGHQRFTPPWVEEGCAFCYTHEEDQTRGYTGHTPLDTIFVTFRNDAGFPRLHTLVADQAILSFLTDSFDHVYGRPTQDARFYTDTFKIRNHVELYSEDDRTKSGHFELISEQQMSSKDYSGVFARHLHMEPISPSCSGFQYSQLWLEGTLEVTTTSQFGGFGWLHNDVYVETEATLAPGFASLGLDGNCYEQHAGILRMENLWMDKGAQVKVSIGSTANKPEFVEPYYCETGTRYNLGEYADLIDVDSLVIRERIQIELAIRKEGLYLDGREGVCYPLIRYKSVDPDQLKYLEMKKQVLAPEDHPSISEVYYLSLRLDTACHIVNLCITPQVGPIINRRVEIPTVSGVTSTPLPGIHYVPSHTDFALMLAFTTPQPLAVTTSRIIGGVREAELSGRQTRNGEYEYVIRSVQEDVYLQIGPGYASANGSVDGRAIWSHNNTLYIKVEKEDIASIYSIAGQLVRRLDVPEGNTAVLLARGVYIITLRDGSIHKVIIK
jgi:hypothetical protein